jgi:hypothetical protein
MRWQCTRRKRFDSCNAAGAEGTPATAPQPCPSLVGALILQMIKERAADQLALRQREDQLAGRDTPPTGLDRPRAPLPTKFTIDF